MKLKTLKGSPIKRSKYGVGKLIGHEKYYVHIDYADEIMPISELFAFSFGLPDDFSPNSVLIDFAKYEVRFDEAPDFDTAREPRAGLTYRVHRNGFVEKRVVDQIWHHKWLWVKDDYKGFDIQESFNWSKEWLSKLNERAYGSPARWAEQLKKIGLK